MVDTSRLPEHVRGHSWSAEDEERLVLFFMNASPGGRYVVDSLGLAEKREPSNARFVFMLLERLALRTARRT
jgi:hypothetical protein